MGREIGQAPPGRNLKIALDFLCLPRNPTSRLIGLGLCPACHHDAPYSPCFRHPALLQLLELARPELAALWISPFNFPRSQELKHRPPLHLTAHPGAGRPTPCCRHPFLHQHETAGKHILLLATWDLQKKNWPINSRPIKSINRLISD